MQKYGVRFKKYCYPTPGMIVNFYSVQIRLGIFLKSVTWQNSKFWLDEEIVDESKNWCVPDDPEIAQHRELEQLAETVGRVEVLDGAEGYEDKA